MIYPNSLLLLRHLNKSFRIISKRTMHIFGLNFIDSVLSRHRTIYNPSESIFPLYFLNGDKGGNGENLNSEEEEKEEASRDGSQRNQGWSSPHHFSNEEESTPPRKKQPVKSRIPTYDEFERFKDSSRPPDSHYDPPLKSTTSKPEEPPEERS